MSYNMEGFATSSYKIILGEKIEIPIFPPSTYDITDFIQYFSGVYKS